MTDRAISSDPTNGLCILGGSPGVNVTTAQADQAFGAGNYSIEDETVINATVNKAYFPVYSWNVSTDSLVVDIVKARTCRMDQFKVLRIAKWESIGTCEDPHAVIIALFTGQDLTDLNSMKTMVADEQVVLDTKTTIAELEAYIPSYLV